MALSNSRVTFFWATGGKTGNLNDLRKLLSLSKCPLLDGGGGGGGRGVANSGDGKLVVVVFWMDTFWSSMSEKPMKEIVFTVRTDLYIQINRSSFIYRDYQLTNVPMG